MIGPDGKKGRNTYAIGPYARERALYLSLVIGLEYASDEGFAEANIHCPLVYVANGIFNGQHSWPIDAALEAALSERLGRFKRWMIESPDLATHTGTEE